jgi:superfamily II DNA or RNA helicase
VIPSRFVPAFSPSTIQQFDAVAKRLAIRSPLFFRSAYTAYVVENERRTFAPIVVVDPAKITRWWCSCNEQLRFGDLCRHLAAVLATSSNADGQLTNERYEASFWRSVGFESFTEGRQVAEPPHDKREDLLRKYVMTDQELELLRRGAGSTRTKWESSAWYRWSKEQFIRFGDGEGAMLSIRDGGAQLALGDSELVIPKSAVEYVISAGDGAIARTSGFALAPESLTPSLRLELTPAFALKLVPVVIDSIGTIHERASLARFGRWLLLDETFATLRDVPLLFGDSGARGQAALFEVRPTTGLPFDRETLIPESEVFAFVSKHRHALSLMPRELVPQQLRDARFFEEKDEVSYDFAPATSELLDVDVVLHCGGELIPAADIAAARKEKKHVLVRGNVWIDVADAQFAWLDATRFYGAGRMLLTKLEYLRVRSLVRGKAVFRGDEATEAVFRVFDDLHDASAAPTPAALGIDLYGYQQTGYHWLWLLQQNGFGGLLCDDMGLGKTHQAMALIRALCHPERSEGSGREGHATDDSPSLTLGTTPSILIVCPTSVIDHWREKLARYLPDIPFTIHYGAGRGVRRDARLIVTSYGVLRSDLERLRARTFDLLIVDEIQTIKNPDTATHQALRAIDRRIAIGLTGTPVENHERELKTLVDFVVPGYLPATVNDRRLLQRLVRPFVLRRTKAQVLPELPPKIVDKRYCELTPEQRAIYRSVIESRAEPLRAQLRAGAKIPYIHVFAALNYLKQICNHPASLRGPLGADVPSGKWELFTELLDECMTSGLKVVVFSQYLSMLELIEQHLDRNNIGFASIKGATRERGAEVKRFRDDPECRVFTASLRAAGVGIDLTSASVVIHYDRWWNQAREDQATDRVHRLGQNKGVQVIKLITRHTLEEKIDALVESKAALAHDLIQTDDPSLVKQFTPEELDQLLGWDE